MPRVNGYELVDGLRRFDRRPTVVIATAMTDSLIGLLDAEIVHSIIRKPFDIEILGSLMSAIVGKSTTAQGDTEASPRQHTAPRLPPGQPC